MLSEFANPQLSWQMLENAIGAAAMSFIAVAAIAAAFVFLYAVWQCAALTREPVHPRPPRPQEGQVVEAASLPELSLSAENLIS